MKSTKTSTVYLTKFHKGYFKGLPYGYWEYTEDPCEAMQYSRFRDAEKRGKDAKKLNYAGHYLDDLAFIVETWTATVSVTMEPVTKS